MGRKKYTHQLQEDGKINGASEYVYDLWKIGDAEKHESCKEKHSINGYNLKALWLASLRTLHTLDHSEEEPHNIHGFRSVLPEDLEDTICFLMGGK